MSEWPKCRACNGNGVLLAPGGCGLGPPYEITCKAEKIQ